jgi:integrase
MTMATKPKPPASSTKRYAHNALAENTRRAHQADLARFVAWGGAIPSDPAQLVEYVSAHAQSHRPSTLVRWLASISKAHQSQGLANPCTSHEVREEMRGIRNTVGSEQRRVAPAMRDELMAMVDSLEETTTGMRDKALLLVGFSAALRRSELAALTIQRLHFDRRGLLISLGKSKTDQAGAGAAIAVPRAKAPAYCPVGALKAWLAEVKRAKHDGGPVFRRISKAGTIHADPLNAASIARIVKGHAMKAGLDPALYSGHSLRAGLATSSAQEGKAFHKIKAQTRHKSDATLLRYVRDGELFRDNAADLL